MRYLVVVCVLVVISVPAFVGLVALGSGQVLNMAYDKVAIRLNDKMALAAEQPGRRILAFGGSSTFFDFRGADIEEATGLPAINIGTHSGNGLRFLLWQAETVARQGDIVILPLEDGYYREPGITYYGANVSLAAGGDFFRALPPGEQIVYLRNIHIRRLLKVAAARLGISDYELEPDWALPINANGDTEVPDPPATQVSALIAEVSDQRAKTFEFVPPARERIGEFVARMKERGVTVLFSLPGAMETIVPTDRQVVELRKTLAAAGADFLDPPERGAIPAEMMFDTIYHASRPGAGLYTAQLIAALCADADRLGIACDSGEVRAAAAMRRGADERSYLFGAPEDLESLQPWGDGTPVALPVGKAASFMVAALRNCRNRVRISVEGSGILDISIGGKPVDPLILSGAPETVTRALPNAPGLVTVDLTPEPGSAIRLAGVKRVSACK